MNEPEELNVHVDLSCAQEPCESLRTVGYLKHVDASIYCCDALMNISVLNRIPPHGRFLVIIYTVESYLLLMNHRR